MGWGAAEPLVLVDAFPGLGDPVYRVQIGPMTIAGLDGVPRSGAVPEPSTPRGHMRAMLCVARPVAGRDHPEAALRDESERIGVVVHEATVGQGADGAGRHP